MRQKSAENIIFYDGICAFAIFGCVSFCGLIPPKNFTFVHYNPRGS